MTRDRAGCVCARPRRPSTRSGFGRHVVVNVVGRGGRLAAATRSTAPFGANEVP